MANQRSLAGLGNVVRADKGSKAKIETWHEGEKHKFSGPLRQNEESEQHAYEDLRRIRAAAEAANNRREGLIAMRSTAEELRAEARTAQIEQPREFQGDIEEGVAYSYRARMRYKKDTCSTVVVVRGPTRTSWRRAETDLAKLREASQGHDTWTQQLRAVQAEVERLIIQAQRENGVALGIDMYEAKRMEHKTDDSDPSDDDDDEGYETVRKPRL